MYNLFQAFLAMFHSIYMWQLNKIAVQVPSGVFVFLNDVDLIPTPTLHAELTTGKFRQEMQRMRTAYFDSGDREVLVLPAFERLPNKPPGPKEKKNGKRGDAAWPGPCKKAEGCRNINGVAVPRSFDTLRAMLRKGNVVDVFYRRQARSCL